MIPLSDLVFKLSVFFALLSELQCNEARTTNIKMRDKHHHCGTYNCDGGKRKGIAYHNQVYQIACYQGRGFIDDHSNLIWANSTYNGYGCYCGIGGGGRPLDATDSCCMKHDACYDNVKIEYPLLIKQTSQFYNYTYTMKCYQCRNTTSCRYSDNNGAANGLCKCDRKLAICLSSKNASGTYHSGNIGASKKGDCC